jgi:hypothetical protein
MADSRHSWKLAHLLLGRGHNRFGGIREFREEIMFNTGKIAQGLLAVVLAAAFSATAVGAAVGPAHQVETSRIA